MFEGVGTSAAREGGLNNLTAPAHALMMPCPRAAPARRQPDWEPA